MDLTESRPHHPRWRSALKGGLIAVAAPILFSIVAASLFAAATGDGHGVEWIGMITIISSPVLFVFGAVTGLLTRALRDGRNTGVMAEQAPSRRLARAAWGITGALAGFCASLLTWQRWPGRAGSLLGALSIPFLIWIGAVLGLRVAGPRISRRPLHGSVVAAGAAFTVAALLVSLPPLSLSPLWQTFIGGASAMLVGLVAYYRLSGARHQVGFHDPICNLNFGAAQTGR